MYIISKTYIIFFAEKNYQNMLEYFLTVLYWSMSFSNLQAEQLK